MIWDTTVRTKSKQKNYHKETFQLLLKYLKFKEFETKNFTTNIQGYLVEDESSSSCGVYALVTMLLIILGLPPSINQSFADTTVLRNLMRECVRREAITRSFYDHLNSN